ncbi:MAG: metal ABC transporter permease [Acidaminococcaceae bacterium]|jgi:zinc transport system permease protein|nr:metal ABC transporter permease [Acidaminococcaceae bacterium]
MEIFTLDFMQRAWLAGLVMAVLCPVIGCFIVLRRQSMIGDGLGHIAFAGVAGGVFMGFQPVLAAAVATVAGSVIIEKVRTRMHDFADMVLAIFFYAGMALAVIFTSLNHSGGVSLSGILFGSLMTISPVDLYIVGILGLFVIAFVVLLYRPLQYLTFDEVSARVAGLPVESLNLWLSVLTALTVALSMRVVGILLVGAMMVVPVGCALLVSRSFSGTILGGIAFGLLSVVAGMLLSYYASLAPGGTIVLTGVACFVLCLLFRNR